MRVADVDADWLAVSLDAIMNAGGLMLSIRSNLLRVRSIFNSKFRVQCLC